MIRRLLLLRPRLACRTHATHRGRWRRLLRTQRRGVRRVCHRDVIDLVDRYAPDILRGDIGYPAAGIPQGPISFANVLDRFYQRLLVGVVNDRWGLTHWDFRTSEYQQGREIQGRGMWQSCRGIGYSFGYNQLEDARHYLDAPRAIKELVDVVSRGGNLLLNVGPDAAGRIPEMQRSCLEGMATWMAVNAAAVHGAAPVDSAVAGPATSRGRAGPRAAGSCTALSMRRLRRTCRAGPTPSTWNLRRRRTALASPRGRPPEEFVSTSPRSRLAGLPWCASRCADRFPSARRHGWR